MIVFMNAPLQSGLCLLLAACASAFAQVVPTTPGKFKMKPLGETGASAGISSAPKPAETTYRQITHIALSPPRQWKSSDGKSLLGKLIAFEDVIVETKGAAPDPSATPAMPATITVVRDGKARLLVNSKAYEISLDRLGDDERKFVAQVEKAVAVRKP